MMKRSIKYRLANDFQLAVISLLAAVTLLGLVPFAIWRAMNGQWAPFIMDILIQIGIAGAVIHAWRSGSTRGASLFGAYFLGVMTLTAVHLLGEPGRYWLYPYVAATFFLAGRRHAVALTLLCLLALPLTGTRFASLVEAASFVTTVVVCALFAYVLAYRVALQRDQLVMLAARDPLTGIYNRRTLIEDIDRVHEVFRREQRRYAILMIDLDEFKQVNDRQGHLAGDKVLIAFCRLVERNIRKGDRLYRFGGEEFVVLVPAAHEAGLGAMAEKLRMKVADNLKAPNGQAITISIGGAILRPGETVADWFARADTALYVAKESGRNKSVVDGDITSPTPNPQTSAIAPPTIPA